MTVRHPAPSTGGRRRRPRSASSPLRPARYSCGRRSSSAARATPRRSTSSRRATRTATFFEDEIRSPIQVGDLAAAVFELAALDLAGPLNVAGSDDVSRADLAELVTGAPVRRAPAPPARPLDCSLDSSRARALLWTPLRGVRDVFR